MFKKTILALAAAVAMFGFGTLVQSAPAEAQTWRHGQPAQHRMQSPRVQHNWQRARVQHNWRSTQVRRNWQGHGTWRHRHHHRYYGYYGGYWGFAPLYGGTYIYPPGVYGGDCRLVKRHVRVLTDRGWRWRWRTYRICY